jgi:putative endonuclease
MTANYVYVLAIATGRRWRTYVGWTTDLDRRVKQHNSGAGAKSTRGNVWVCIYAERYGTRGEAMSREAQLKRDRRFRTQLKPA